MVGSASPPVTISVAPRRPGWGKKGRASCRSPGSATKQLPGSTRRESSVTEETDEGGAPTTVLTGSAARSSLTGISRAISFRRPWRESERSEEHTSELQSRLHLVCRLLLEKKKKK